MTQDRDTRTSKEGAIFGFESIKAGQEFIFSIKYTSDTEIAIIDKLLTGKKRIGKSKSAEFGQVDIQPLTLMPEKIGTFQENDFTLVYAESNLCFIDENTGQSTYKPTAEQLGIESGTIDWNKSSIRTYSYSPWNFRRNINNMQRNCILKGSVFYVENGVQNTQNKPIGEFVAEGMGRVIYNPIFLKAKVDGVLDFRILDGEKHENKRELKPIAGNCKTDLGKTLFDKYKTQKLELEIANQVVYEVSKNENKELLHITSSQWGGIRAIATNETNYSKLHTKLFADKTGYLTHGVADEKHWSKNRKRFEEIFNQKPELGSVFIAKLAGEFAKLSKKLNP